jgi:hypothetical protein
MCVCIYMMCTQGSMLKLGSFRTKHAAVLQKVGTYPKLDENTVATVTVHPLTLLEYYSRVVVARPALTHVLLLHGLHSLTCCCCMGCSNMDASQLARTHKVGEQDGRVAQADRHVIEVRTQSLPMPCFDQHRTAPHLTSHHGPL